ncbi:hypothetical protein B0I03_10539 [Flavobacterium aquaticum]|uniref:Uncharacterized protein n=1 Tax=Flavobacterium aquaticum TaxID=1236486 RepID=A0A327YMU5_9FLAO|nr:hypothetical protein [Flavobacterium aquaticum]RAK21607.1 hypothetical protein B0I03_10539 [Flavobacterium aquaticum]
MNKIITATEIKNYKDIGNKVDENKINPIIEQAQLTELKDVLGSEFYFDVLNNLNNPIYQDLLSGSTFTYNDIVYHQDGLKALTADYFMAKYVMQINTNITPFGATIKQSNDSVPAERNSLKDISTMQMQLAGSRWEQIKKYLDANKEIFPKWKSLNCTSSPSGERIMRIRKI